jgi:hypothetical protein
MINLVINENIVTLTLSENNTIGTNAQYLFEFYSNETRQSIFFLSSDINFNQDNQSRFNEFNISVVLDIKDQNLENSIIYLPNKGFYEYKVYAQIEPNLVPQETDVLCEYGRVYYEFSEASITSFNPDIEIIVYNGE